MQKITPFLWFDHQAEEAMNFYTTVFKNSKITSMRRNGEGGFGKKGEVFTGTFVLDGQEFMALNGGPLFKFNESISMFVDCKDQDEVDYFWEKLSEGGEKSQCGWLKDKFGLSWQVIPRQLGDLLGQKDPQKANRVMQAMLKMQKLIIKDLEEAGKG
jgi:predicted 3-demethylubiquinone-9 3-methyltransferase (glyoxalase superfamily)